MSHQLVLAIGDNTEENMLRHVGIEYDYYQEPLEQTVEYTGAPARVKTVAEVSALSDADLINAYGGIMSTGGILYWNMQDTIPFDVMFTIYRNVLSWYEPDEPVRVWDVHI